MEKAGGTCGCRRSRPRWRHDAARSKTRTGLRHRVVAKATEVAPRGTRQRTENTVRIRARSRAIVPCLAVVFKARIYFLLAATLLRSTPILEISISTLSLGFMNSPVVAPTPEMVPVLIRSPGSRVMMAEMYSMIMATG